MPYAIEFRPAVLKSLQRFPKRDLIRIKKKIEELGKNLACTSQTCSTMYDNGFLPRICIR